MKILLMIFLFIGSIVFVYGQSEEKKTDYKPVVKFDPSRDPGKDLKDAIVEAKKTNKRILLDVGGEWCIWCHYLDDFFKKHKDVAEFMRNNFVVLKINYSPENENKEFLFKFPEIPGYPHFFVLDNNGKLIHSQGTAELEEGRGHDREMVFGFLKKWAIKS